MKFRIYAFIRKKKNLFYLHIDWNCKHLLISNFTESLLLKCSNPYKILQDSSDVYYRQIFPIILKNEVLFDTLGGKTSHKYSKRNNVPNVTHRQKRHIQNLGAKTAHKFSMRNMYQIKLTGKNVPYKITEQKRHNFRLSQFS